MGNNKSSSPATVLTHMTTATTSNSTVVVSATEAAHKHNSLLPSFLPASFSASPLSSSSASSKASSKSSSSSSSASSSSSKEKKKKQPSSSSVAERRLGDLLLQQSRLQQAAKRFRDATRAATSLKPRATKVAKKKSTLKSSHKTTIAKSAPSVSVIGSTTNVDGWNEPSLPSRVPTTSASVLCGEPEYTAICECDTVDLTTTAASASTHAGRGSRQHSSARRAVNTADEAFYESAFEMTNMIDRMSGASAACDSRAKKQQHQTQCVDRESRLQQQSIANQSDNYFNLDETDADESSVSALAATHIEPRSPNNATQKLHSGVASSGHTGPQQQAVSLPPPPPAEPAPAHIAAANVASISSSSSSAAAAASEASATVVQRCSAPPFIEHEYDAALSIYSQVKATNNHCKPAPPIINPNGTMSRHQCEELTATSINNNNSKKTNTTKNSRSSSSSIGAAATVGSISLAPARRNHLQPITKIFQKLTKHHHQRTTAAPTATPVTSATLALSQPVQPVGGSASCPPQLPAKCFDPTQELYEEQQRQQQRAASAATPLMALENVYFKIETTDETVDVDEEEEENNSDDGNNDDEANAANAAAAAVAAQAVDRRRRPRRHFRQRHFRTDSASAVPSGVDSSERASSSSSSIAEISPNGGGNRSRSDSAAVIEHETTSGEHQLELESGGVGDGAPQRMPPNASLPPLPPPPPLVVAAFPHMSATVVVGATVNMQNALSLHADTNININIHNNNNNTTDDYQSVPEYEVITSMRAPPLSTCSGVSAADEASVSVVTRHTHQQREAHERGRAEVGGFETNVTPPPPPPASTQPSRPVANAAAVAAAAAASASGGSSRLVDIDDNGSSSNEDNFVEKETKRKETLHRISTDAQPLDSSRIDPVDSVYYMFAATVVVATTATIECSDDEQPSASAGTLAMSPSKSPSSSISTVSSASSECASASLPLHLSCHQQQTGSGAEHAHSCCGRVTHHRCGGGVTSIVRVEAGNATVSGGANQLRHADQKQQQQQQQQKLGKQQRPSTTSIMAKDRGVSEDAATLVVKL